MSDRTLVLYASHKCEHKDSQPLRIGKSIIWIRAEDRGKDSLDDALSNAQKMPYETVLNSIYKTVNKGLK